MPSRKFENYVWSLGQPTGAPMLQDSPPAAATSQSGPTFAIEGSRGSRTHQRRFRTVSEPWEQLPVQFDAGMPFSNSLGLYDVDSRPSSTLDLPESGRMVDVEMSSLPSAEWGPLDEGSTSIRVQQEYPTCVLFYSALSIEIQVLFV